MLQHQQPKMISDQHGDIYLKLDAKGSTSDSDGEVWDDGPAGTVKEMCIYHGKLIYSIQTSYERQGTTSLSRRHGGAQGSFEQITLSEPITWVSGHHGSWCCDPLPFADEEQHPWCFCKVIRSLKFGSDRASYGPFGREVGEPFSFKFSSGIRGFHGRSSDGAHGYLNALGVYCKSMASCLLDGPATPAAITSSPPSPSPSISSLSLN